MKLAFLSDLHLNFVPISVVNNLCVKIIANNPDVIVITGDTAEAPSLHVMLKHLADTIEKPIYYVHGNHDFYRGSFDAVRQISTYNSTLPGAAKWIQGCGIVKLTDNSCLLGHDGWYDVRYGHFLSSHFELADFEYISDIKPIYRRDRLQIFFNKLGDEYADYIRKNIPLAAKDYKNIYFMSHIPPFAEAALYRGIPSPDYSVCFFACKAAGEALLDMREQFPNNNIYFLCGHSHDQAEVNIDNLHVFTANATYGSPDVYKYIEVE